MKDLPSEEEIKRYEIEADVAYNIPFLSINENQNGEWIEYEDHAKSLRYCEWKAERFAEWIYAYAQKLYQRDIWMYEEQQYTITELFNHPAFIAHLNSLPQPE